MVVRPLSRRLFCIAYRRMLGELGRFVVALWHVVGLLLLARPRYRVRGRGVASAEPLFALPPPHPSGPRRYRRCLWRRRLVGRLFRRVPPRRPRRLEALCRMVAAPVPRRLRDARRTRVAADPGREEADGDAIRILCFGGSTMMGMGARDDQTIPAVLARRLAETGHRVSVTNYGQLGHNSTQEVITLQQLLKSGERLDIALFYDGINEMACAEQTGRADGLFNEARRRAEFNSASSGSAARSDCRRVDQCGAADLAAAAPIDRPCHCAAHCRWTKSDLSQVDLAELARDVIAAYLANMRLVRLLAEEYGFQPIFFWQPVITTKKFKTPDERRWVDDYTKDPERRRLFYEAIIDERRHRPELVEASDAIDLSALFDDWTSPSISICTICRRPEMRRSPKRCCRLSPRSRARRGLAPCRDRREIADGMVDPVGSRTSVFAVGALTAGLHRSRRRQAREPARRISTHSGRLPPSRLFPLDRGRQNLHLGRSVHFRWGGDGNAPSAMAEP